MRQTDRQTDRERQTETTDTADRNRHAKDGQTDRLAYMHVT